jgi:hypothetical protein
MYRWIVPAILSFLFLAFSVIPIAREGLAGLIAVHTLNWWAAQVTIDLVLAATTAFSLAIPEARRQGIGIAPWLVATIALGSIGLLAFVARVQSARGGRYASARARASSATAAA